MKSNTQLKIETDSKPSKLTEPLPEPIDWVYKGKDIKPVESPTDAPQAPLPEPILSMSTIATQADLIRFSMKIFELTPQEARYKEAIKAGNDLIDIAETFYLPELNMHITNDVNMIITEIAKAIDILEEKNLRIDVKKREVYRKAAAEYIEKIVETIHPLIKTLLDKPPEQIHINESKAFCAKFLGILNNPLAPCNPSLTRLIAALYEEYCTNPDDDDAKASKKKRTHSGIKSATVPKDDDAKNSEKMIYALQSAAVKELLHNIQQKLGSEKDPKELRRIVKIIDNMGVINRAVLSEELKAIPVPQTQASSMTTTVPTASTSKSFPKQQLYCAHTKLGTSRNRSRGTR